MKRSFLSCEGLSQSARPRDFASFLLRHPAHGCILDLLPGALKNICVHNCFDNKTECLLIFIQRHSNYVHRDLETRLLRQASHADPNLNPPLWPASESERLFPCHRCCRVCDADLFWQTYTGSALTRGGSGPSTASPRCLSSWTECWWRLGPKTRSWRESTHDVLFLCSRRWRWVKGEWYFT